MTTQGAIAALRGRHPGVEIGMIVANAGRPAIERAGLVDRLHVIDHWWVSRKLWTGKEKRCHFRATHNQALAEMRAARYQVGFDFYPFFPPAHPLFYRAGIPVRVGYTSGGFGPLLTHQVAWPNAKLPVTKQYRELLNALHPDAPFSVGSLKPARDPATLHPLPPNSAVLGRYIAVHPSAGASYKEWGIGHWRALVERLVSAADGRYVAVTSGGASEIVMAAEISAVSPSIVNMAGKVE